MRTIETGIMQAHLENRLSDDFALEDLSLDEETLADPFTKSEFRILRQEVSDGEEKKILYYIISAGPDKTYDSWEEPFDFTAYDSTNGSTSVGDIVRLVEVEKDD